MSKVTVKGQVTIPKAVRDALRIGPGSVVESVTIPDGRIVLRKAEADGPRRNGVGHVRGSAGSGISTDQVMALMRGN
jgi:AbrB family looped-hinge helix DNA binding protein